jgi:FAD/FMN-containing dehydrogenase
MSTTTAAALTLALTRAGVDATDDRERCRAASRDYSWLSPILTDRLPDDMAATVAFPHNVDELAAAVGVASHHQTPLTLRGRGTGNYGQAVPLFGGLVIDTSAMDGDPEISDGWALVEPGVTCSTLERVAREAGQEMAIFPSTTNSTIGGFLAGGAGGSGSIRHGFVWDGFVDGLDVLDCRAKPTLTAVAGAATRPFLHTYGTTGVLATARIRLDPVTRWTAVLASFDHFGDAAGAGAGLLASTAALRLLGITEAALVADLGPRSALPDGRTSLRAVVAEDDLDDLRATVVSAGGRMEAAGTDLIGVVTALSYNHVTLRAKRVDPGICHLQVGGPALTERTDEIRRSLPEARLHLDAMRSPAGPGFGGLLISRFVGEPQLRERMAALQALGVRVVDPHTWMVEDPDGSAAAAARRMDPAGLLNPGKLIR